MAFDAADLLKAQDLPAIVMPQASDLLIISRGGELLATTPFGGILASVNAAFASAINTTTGAATAAATSATLADQRATAAGDSATASTNQATIATSAASNAQAYRDAAAGYASSSSTSAGLAAGSASAAATSASNLSAAVGIAQGHADAASASATLADQRATNAQTSASNAATSASTAATAALNLETAVGEAQGYAGSASASSSAAQTFSTNAQNAATAAAGSASSASTAALNLASAVSAAQGYRDGAAGHAGAAAASASASETFATNAQNAATAASGSASAAASSATNLSSAVGAAQGYRDSAAGYSGASATYASNAQTYATNAYNSWQAAVTLEQSVTSTVGGLSSQVSILASAVNGMSARFQIVMDVNGYASGLYSQNTGTVSDLKLKFSQLIVESPSGNYTPLVVDTTLDLVRISNVLITGKILTNSSTNEPGYESIDLVPRAKIATRIPNINDTNAYYADVSGWQRFVKVATFYHNRADQPINRRIRSGWVSFDIDAAMVVDAYASVWFQVLSADGSTVLQDVTYVQNNKDPAGGMGCVGVTWSTDVYVPANAQVVWYVSVNVDQSNMNAATGTRSIEEGNFRAIANN